MKALLGLFMKFVLRVTAILSLIATSAVAHPAYIQPRPVLHKIKNQNDPSEQGNPIVTDSEPGTGGTGGDGSKGGNGGAGGNGGLLLGNGGDGNSGQ